MRVGESKKPDSKRKYQASSTLSKGSQLFGQLFGWHLGSGTWEAGTWEAGTWEAGTWEAAGL